MIINFRMENGYTVTLTGGGPWGIRIQGGKDFSIPLSIRYSNKIVNLFYTSAFQIFENFRMMLKHAFATYFTEFIVDRWTDLIRKIQSFLKYLISFFKNLPKVHC